MAPDRFTHTVHVNAPPERAWTILQEPETWGGIAGVQRVFDASHHPDGTLRSYRFLAQAGMKPYEGSARTVQADAPVLMVVTVDAAEIEGTITTELQPSNPHGTDMTVSLGIRARGILASLFLPIVSQAIGSGFSRQIDEIARRIEHA
ncbi:MAG TPA: SRPBCC family protein [Acidimicrobiia bacterium]|nr:SRPBCC family protein [Acidimicrobiia bacterium]